MKKNRIPMILLLITGLLIVGSCEKDPDPVIIQPNDPYEEDQTFETREEADEYKRECPGVPQV